ncbi:hypothetical protein MSAN_02450400 [Mycena sanguinolenta]|uniref:Uncharacterized protein n=1 Tax=Mycena sanguinolenta TaxID=230812 RepID=A0A8H6WXZ8_9AGAR|nr:hypothetical protein MSAN_02450400 [Mycena sanguinolenta]
MERRPRPESYEEYSSAEDPSSEQAAVSLLTMDHLVDRLEPSVATERKGFLRKHLLSALCFTLHLWLVLVHVAILISAIKHWEHRFTFPIEHQTTVSFWTTVVTQSFGTIYCALLVFVTQRLAMRHNLGLTKTLTAAHDCISAWAGLGSALTTLLNQVFVPASVFGTLNIVGYLGCISVLHITIPAILSLEAFNATVAVSAITSGFPEYANSMSINSTQDYMTTFPARFLPWRGIFDDSLTLGLSGSSLYEMLKNTTSRPGQAQVAALGFKISCGYLSADSLNPRDPAPEATGFMFDIGENPAVQIFPSVLPNEVSIINNNDNSIYMYTTATVVDSHGAQGSPFIFSQQSPSFLQNITGINLKTSQIQFLQCFKSSVAQSGVIDSQSNAIAAGSLYPNIQENYSAWILASEVVAPAQSSSLLDSWSEILGHQQENNDDGTPEEYLMTYLGLNPLTNVSSVVSLHDIENALSNLVAMIFWTAGHVQVNPWYIKYSLDPNGDVPDAGAFPVLDSGNATILQLETTQVRLTSNLIVVIVGLATSVVEMLLCIPFLLAAIQHPVGPQSAGLLHTIWLWRNHRGFSPQLRNVHWPRETTLRKAGLIPLQQHATEYGHRHTKWEHSKNPQDEGVPRDHWSSTMAAHLLGPEHATMCLVLHILLVVAYVAALVFAVARKEHSVIFSINKQQNVSFLCKVATTAFGTIYYTVLIYWTQRLAVACLIQQHSLLAATHDKVWAWTGTGSALSALYHQIKWPTSSVGIFAILLYWGAISILHVTTPALVSVESFNFSVPTNVETRSIPQWSDNSHSSTLLYLTTTGPFLPWINYLDPSKKIGLSNASLYDVLEQSYPGSGPTGISAVGFNISCGYVPNITVTTVPVSPEYQAEGDYPLYNISSDANNLYWPSFFQTGKKFPISPR